MTEIAAPGGGAAPAAPAAPVAPAAPAPSPNGPAPGSVVAPTVKQPSAEETAQAKEDKEWDDAANEAFPNQKKDGKDEPAKPEKTAEEIAAEAANPNGEESDASKGAGDGSKKENESDKSEFDTSARASRLAQREYQQRVEAIKSDIRSKMFADVPKTLQDADGDPITSVDDVMQLLNPKTGEKFESEEEAGMWLLNAQRQFNEKIADVEKKLDAFSDVNADVKDQADAVNHKYGEFLKANPELRDKLWAQFEKTLQKDEATDIITAAPVSLEEFYDFQLSPRMEQKAAPTEPEALVAPAAPEQTPEQKAAEESKAKAEAEKQRQQKRADRSDIYVAPQQGTEDSDDKEWGEAAKSYYGNAIK